MPKRCAVCKTEKSIDSFRRDASKKSGRRSACKACERKKDHARRVKNASPRTRATQMIENARRRAKKNGLKFELSFEWAVPQIQNGICPFTGKAFLITRPPRGMACHPDAPSIDQRKPGAGYSKRNARIVSAWANMAKGNLTEAEFVARCKAVVERHTTDG